MQAAPLWADPWRQVSSKQTPARQRLAVLMRTALRPDTCCGQTHGTMLAFSSQRRPVSVLFSAPTSAGASVLSPKREHRVLPVEQFP